jgi:RNA polymerase sigma-70 factor (ECF subfamily)
VWDSDGIEGWLIRVTRNRCIDRCRSLRSESRVVDRGREPTILGGCPDHRPDPERRAAASQLRRRIAVAVSLLPEPQRSVVILREIQGLSYDAIAGAVEISVANVKVSLHRGRRRLRQRLEEVHDHVVAV